MFDFNNNYISHFDSIYTCQLFGVCPIISEEGKVDVDFVEVVPSTGTVGTTFTISIDYNVTLPLGPGLIDMVLIPPNSIPALCK